MINIRNISLTVTENWFLIDQSHHEDFKSETKLLIERETG